MLTRTRYLEAVDILYGTPTYCFNHVGHVVLFLERMPPSHRDRLRSIEVTHHVSPFLYGQDDFHPERLPQRRHLDLVDQVQKWIDTFNQLERLNLVYLKIALFPDPISAPLPEEKRLLAAINALANVRELVLELPSQIDSYLSMGVDDIRARRGGEVGHNIFTVHRRQPVGDVKTWLRTYGNGWVASMQERDSLDWYFCGRHREYGWDFSRADFLRSPIE
jgi:hypothetical protein